ncbi:MAG: glycine--tRNA ligase [Euryarchaeota archaeon]|nr:glycine--tRNA ligase [Euryarchaeota archaeon]
MDEDKLLALAKRRGFFYPAFEIYGGVAGLYEYGPMGAALKANIADRWRRFYVLGEGFAEIDSPNVSPEEVFAASGHVKEFTDFSVECTKCREAFRADHLVKDIENPAALGADGLSAALKGQGAKCPSCGGELSVPQKVNLMFKTQIGPTANSRVGYLRPETAQAMFFSFVNHYRHFREQLPFGVVQVGRGFRNEISPRQGLLRQREFNMMEAEVFVHPERKTWPRFHEVADDRLRLVSNDGKEHVIAAKDAVHKGIIKNEALAYFVALTQRFLLDVGIDPKRLRFRQHLTNEMAHYASDCWDAEVELSYGWVEAVGVADRGSYDLDQHIRHSGAQLTAFERFAEANEVERDVIAPVHARLGPLFKGKAKAIAAAMESAEGLAVESDGTIKLAIDGAEVTVPPECFERKRVREKVSGRRFVPHVIEPSYGLDRILYSVMEHSYHEEEKEEYTVMRLPISVAPIKFGVFPLMAKDGLDGFAMKLDAELRDAGVVTSYDDSGSIGRRYARMDEVGTPFCVTVDHETLEKGTVTIRDRDSKAQVRVPAKELAALAPRLLRHGFSVAKGGK